MNDGILTAQQKRANLRQKSSTASVSELLATYLTTPTSGDADVPAERCKVHPTHTVPCEECERQAREAETAAERVKQRRISMAFDGLRLGKRYKGRVFEDYEPTCADARKIKERCQRYAGAFHDRLKSGDSLIFTGNPGTGKNLLAAAICNHIVGEGYTAVHTTAMKLVRRIRSTWGAKENEQDVIDSFRLPDLLVIDEIGVQFGTLAEQIQLTEVINDRYEDRRPTILISNLDAAGVESFLGTRIMDRFYEGHSAAFSFTWESFRRRRQ